MSTHATLADPVRAAQLKKRARTTGFVLAGVVVFVLFTVWYARLGHTL
jgi:hypothetical protein